MGNDYEVLWTTEEEIVGWHHRLDGHELGQTPEDGEGQRGLACYGPWGHKVSHTAWQLNNNEKEGLWNLTSISAL